MCNECWKEFKGWMRSFTRSECALTALQLLLLVVFIAFLTFLILHLLVCSPAKHIYEIKPTETTREEFNKSSQTNTTLIPISSTNGTTLSPDIECTWIPSKKTDSVVHYYENGQVSTVAAKDSGATSTSDGAPDGEPAGDLHRSYLLALGKVNIAQDVTFGCILTIISEHCALTAASCIESIEEVDSVDAFVMIERYEDGLVGQIHIVSDVLIHPEYQGINKKYDAAVLKSEDSLIEHGQAAVTLPSMLDALVITIGEEFSVLGYGPSVAGARARGVRALAVRALAGTMCAGGWAPRHLACGAATREARGGCGAAPLCAGRAGRCGACAGAPLLRAARLQGVRAAGGCGEGCGPALYVNVAALLDWLNSTMYNK